MNKIINISYFNPSLINNNINFNSYQGVSMWQGIRKYQNTYIISGTSNPSPATGISVLYIGNIQCTNTSNIYTIQIPNSIYSSGYGPDYNKNTDTYYLVGCYTPNTSNTNLGYLFKTNNLSTITDSCFFYPDLNNLGYDYIYCHSIANNFMVGNAIALKNNASQTIQSIKAFIYNTNKYTNNILTTKTFFKFPNSTFTSIYGIVHNKNNSYTITGGYGINNNYNQIYNSNNLPKPYFKGFIADYNSLTNKFYNYTSISTNKKGEICHVQGITKLPNNKYGLSVDVFNNKLQQNKGYFVELTRSSNNYFYISRWTPLKPSPNSYATANSVAGYNVVGKIISSTNVVFQCNINFNNINNNNNNYFYIRKLNI